MKIIVNENEVSWVFGSKINPGPQAMSAVRQYMGAYAENFMPISIGMGMFSWELPDDGWERISHAQASEAGKIREAYSKFCGEALNAAKAKVGGGAMHFVNNVFTVPNDDYVFYKVQADGSVKFQIAAWGFRNLVRPTGGPMRKDLNKKNQQVKCGFSVDGVMQPQRGFTSCFAHQQIPTHFETAEDGFYAFSQGISEGEKITIVDDDTKRVFELLVQKGQSEYVFDVTQMSTVKVLVEHDGAPLPNTNVQLNYNGKSLNAVTADDGTVMFSVAYFKDKSVEAVVNGEAQQNVLQLGENSFHFNFATPAKKATAKVRVNADGMPVEGECVKVFVAGNERLVTTGPDGVATCEFEYTDAFDVAADVRGNVQQKPIANEVLFDFDFVTPVVRTVSVKVVDVAGMPLAGKEISVKQGEQKLYGILDDDGTFRFEDTAFKRGEGVDLTVGGEDGTKIEIPFVLEPDDDEYLFKGVNEKNNSYLFLWIILALLLIAVVAYFVAPYFIGLASSAGSVFSNMLI